MYNCSSADPTQNKKMPNQHCVKLSLNDSDWCNVHASNKTYGFFCCCECEMCNKLSQISTSHLVLPPLTSPFAEKKLCNLPKKKKNINLSMKSFCMCALEVSDKFFEHTGLTSEDIDERNP